MFGKTASDTTTTPQKVSSDVCNIAQGTTITATVKVESNMRLEGTIIGDVTCHGRLVLAPSGLIEGNVISKNILCEGKIKGDIVAQQNIHLFSTAIIEGNIKYPAMQMDTGAVFNGQATCTKGTN